MGDTIYGNEHVAMWFQERCGKPLKFLGCYDATAYSKPRGDLTASRKRVGKGKFETRRMRRGAPGLGSITFRTYRDVLDMIAEAPCAPNIYFMFSVCGADDDPTNWDFLDLLYSVSPTSEDMESLKVGISDDDSADVFLSLPSNFARAVTYKKLTSQEITISLTGQDIHDIVFCDDPECGECEDPTVGCQVGYFVTYGTIGSATTFAVIAKTTDGGATWTALTNPFDFQGHDLSSVDCDGDVVIVGNAEDSEYAYSHDAGGAFTVVDTPVQPVNDVFMLGATKAWLACDAGYIYYSNDRGASVDLQDGGAATAQNLNKIAFATSLRGYAVGETNAFVRTIDGGTIWSAATGPSVGVNLTALAVVPNTKVLLVGDASGNVYWSEDEGDNWETVFTANADTAGGITDIELCDCNRVLFSANNGAGAGTVYESIDGGRSWNELSDVPTNTGINALTCCDPNTYHYAGDAAFLAKAAGTNYRDNLP